MLAPGTLLQNRYHLVRLLGQGGMGAVYEAVDQHLNIPVAVKRTLRIDAGFAKAFAHEARVLAALRHPVIPTVSDYFTEGHGHFLVMRFIPGLDLAAQLSQRGAPFPLDQALRWADQILDALEYLHRQNPPVIHRDIKPQNLKLTDDGTIVLLDFGLAKRVWSETQTTLTNSVAGYTLPYAPLEQIRGEGTNHRSDLFALAATLYHLLTGMKPIDALHRATEVLAGHLDPLVPAAVANPQLPDAITDIVQRALALVPSQRPSSAAELRVLLHQAKIAETTVAPDLGDPAISLAVCAADRAHQTIARPSLHNLPAQLTPIVGRTAELEAVTRLLQRDEVRLITLTGPGGTGKTRLALQVATDLLDHFADGVFLVSLAPIRDPDLVITSIAQSLGVHEAGSQPIVEGLKAYLHEKRLLLVLDNFEHVIAAAPALADLLATVPRLKLLTTSRAALRLRGEREFPVPTLALPDLSRQPTREVLAQYAAIELFVQRAQAVKPDFALTDATATAVAEICLRLDGLPLAIELAAARIKALPVQRLLERLSSRLKLLIGGPRDLPIRQQTLRSTIDWSYNLLNMDEQLLFRRLAVFVGSWTLEAAERICVLLDDAIDVLDGLTSLMDKSLLHRLESAADQPRFRMLETIREYAEEQLVLSGEQEIIRQAHVEYYLVLAEQAEPELTGPEQATWVRRLEMEHDNLRAVLRWTEQHKSAIGPQLAGALWRFWYTHGYIHEGHNWLRVMMDYSHGQTARERSVQSKVLHGAGVLTYVLGDYAQGIVHFEAALTLRRGLGDKPGIAALLNNLGMITHYRGEYTRARTMYEEALAITRELGDRRGIAISLNNLGTTAKEQGDYDQATALIEEGLSLFRMMEDDRSVADLLNNLGGMASACGDYVRAHTMCAESLALFRILDDKPGIAEALLNLGVTACRQDDDDLAVRLLEEALTLSRELGDKWSSALALLSLGSVAQHQSNTKHAAQLYQQALNMYHEVDDKPGIATGLTRLADIALIDRQPARAARLLGAAEKLRQITNFVIPIAERAIAERAIAAARTQLDEESFVVAWDAGRAMTPEQMISYASG